MEANDDTLANGDRESPLRIDLFYSLVTLGSTTIWSVLNSWLLYFYLPPEGIPLVPAALYGLATIAASAVNVIVSLPIGYWSDHVRSRFGRRLPFMAVSALPMLVFFVLLWIPPIDGESVWNLVYLSVFLVLYSVAYSLNQIPYEALLPELALTDHHRVRISAWYAGFQLAAMILAGFAGLLIEGAGYVAMALIYAVVALPLFYLPVAVLRERPGRQIAVTERLGFWRSFSTTLHNRPFLIFVATWSLYWSCMTLVQAAIPFIATEICLLSEADTIYFYIPAVLTAGACYPLVSWLAVRFGKWRVLAGSLLVSAAVLPGLLIIGDWLPVPLLAQGIAWAILQAVATSGAVVLMSAVTAEITDHDEKLTGQRREGTYYAVLGLLDYGVSGLTLALMPLLLLLGRSSADPNGPLGVRLIGVVGGAMMLVAFLIFLRYPFRSANPFGTSPTSNERAAQ